MMLQGCQSIRVPLRTPVTSPRNHKSEFESSQGHFMADRDWELILFHLDPGIDTTSRTSLGSFCPVHAAAQESFWHLITLQSLLGVGTW
jgi:hypothetical protein